MPIRDCRGKEHLAPRKNRPSVLSSEGNVPPWQPGEEWGGAGSLDWGHFEFLRGSAGGKTVLFPPAVWERTLLPALAFQGKGPRETKGGGGRFHEVSVISKIFRYRERSPSSPLQKRSKGIKSFLEEYSHKGKNPVMGEERYSGIRGGVLHGVWGEKHKFNHHKRVPSQ